MRPGDQAGVAAFESVLPELEESELLLDDELLEELSDDEDDAVSAEDEPERESVR